MKEHMLQEEWHKQLYFQHVINVENIDPIINLKSGVIQDVVQHNCCRLKICVVINDW